MRFGKHGEKYIHKGAMRMVVLDVQLEFRGVSCLYRARCVNGATEGTSDRVLGGNCKDRRIKRREVRMGNVIGDRDVLICERRIRAERAEIKGEK